MSGGSSADRWDTQELNGATVPLLPTAPRAAQTTLLREAIEQRPTCPNCSQVYSVGQLACSNCGFFFFGTAGKTNKLNMDIIFATPLHEAPPSEERITEQSPIFLEMDGERVLIPVRDSLIVGRLSPVPGDPKPDINLNNFGADELGVSRQHLRITRQGGWVYVADMGSSNGTFLNGRALRRNQNRVLSNGDELRLGHMRLRVCF